MNQKHSINRSVLFNCIHVYLLKEADEERKILRKNLPMVLGRGFHIPRIHHKKVILELKERGIITGEDKSCVKIKLLKPMPF